MAVTRLVFCGNCATASRPTEEPFGVWQWTCGTCGADCKLADMGRFFGKPAPLKPAPRGGLAAKTVMD